jgi:hypothetical protein
VYEATGNQTSNGIVPKVGRVYSFSLALSANTSAPVDLKPLANLHRIDNVQGVFIANSAGTAQLQVSTSAGATLKIPAQYQGVMPLYLSADNVLTFSGAGTVTVTLLNFPTPAMVWPTEGSGTVQVSGTVSVQDAQVEASLAVLQPQVTPVSRTIAATVAASSKPLMAANAARRYLLIQSAWNAATTSFSGIWLNMLGGAASVGGADCEYLGAGVIYESGEYVNTNAINYFDPVGGLVLTAMEG